MSNSHLSRLAARVKEHGLEGLKDKYHLCGRTPALQLTPEEAQALGEIYIRTNRMSVAAAERNNTGAGSMQTACKLFALSSDLNVREEIRSTILAALERGRLPRFATRALKRITNLHFDALRNPSMLATKHFSGRHGAFASDKALRLRIVESDDATLNFPSWIPWPHGGCPCSDKFGVKVGRWQFLPALEAGWSQFYLGYSLIARPRGSYTQDDIRAVIRMVLLEHGLPDGFRFERGSWESNSIKDLLARLQIELQTVWQSNQKPHIEGGFNSLWNYLSVVDGQVGRFRGEDEKNTLLLQACQAGRKDPRDHFVSLAQTTQALDGALALRNSDKRDSKLYGQWIPEVRHRDLAAERPWARLPADLHYLFSPIVREWTVAKGAVGGHVTLMESDPAAPGSGLKAPFYFAHDELWRSNGHKVRLYFDPSGAGQSGSGDAVIVALDRHAGYVPGDIICRAQLFGEIPQHTRAALGWGARNTSSLGGSSSARPQPSMRGPLSALRRETRAFSVRSSEGRAPRGSKSSEEQDGRGSRTAMETRNSKLETPLLATPERARPALLEQPSRPSNDLGRANSISVGDDVRRLTSSSIEDLGPIGRTRETIEEDIEELSVPSAPLECQSGSDSLCNSPDEIDLGRIGHED